MEEVKRKKTCLIHLNINNVLSVLIFSDIQMAAPTDQNIYKRLTIFSHELKSAVATAFQEYDSHEKAY